jgi:Tol biopolymer transport system component
VGGERAINLTEDSPDDDTMPVYSPDGNSIAFRSERDGGGIFIMGAMGESVRRLTDRGYLPSWSPDGSRIVIATEGVTLPGMHMVPSQLWIVDVNTADEKYLTDGRRPHWSPNGHRIAYDGIWTISADGGGPVELVATTGSLNPVWSPDGKSLLFSRLGQDIFSSNIAKIPISEETGKALGEWEPLTFGPEEFRFDITVSRDGKQIAFTEYLRRMNLYKYDFDPSSESTRGEPIPITRGSRRTNFVDCSPDGQHLVFSQNDDIVISGADGSDARMLVEGPNRDRQPRWSPDGSKVAFRSEYGIWFINPDGSGLEQIDTPQGGANHLYPFWSPDGSYLVYFIMNQGSFIKPLTEASREEPTQIAAYDEEDALFVAWSWSPDGKRLAGYRRRQDGVNAGIVIYDFDTQEFERLTDFGRNPEWLADNRRLIFVGETESGIFLVDSETRNWKQIAPEGALTCPLSADNRSIYTHIPTEEADIWLLTLSQ